MLKVILNDTVATQEIQGQPGILSQKDKCITSYLPFSTLVPNI